MKRFIQKTFYKKRRYVLLLEIVIAIAIISFSLIPLIYPYTLMLIEKKKMIRQVEADRVANVAYVDVLEKIYLEKGIPEFTKDHPLFIKYGSLEGKIYFSIKNKKPEKEPKYFFIETVLQWKKIKLPYHYYFVAEQKD